MRTTGASKKSRALRRFVAALLVATATIPARAGEGSAADAQQPGDPQQPDIIVIAPPLFPDLSPERELDEAAIESYGVSTIDELLYNIQGELGDEDDPPLIIVDGQRVSDVNEIGSLPVEALRNVQVLPRGSAVRAGGTSGQRVVHLSIRRNLRSVTVTAAPRLATDGGTGGGRGETILTHIRGKTRLNLALRGRGEDSLFESDRDIIQPEPRFPYAIGGNVLPYPNLSDEIDPLLSDAGGKPILVAPIPAGASPTLADFAAASPNQADLGRFRTLRPETRSYELNGTARTPLTPWLTSSASIRLGRTSSESLRGLPSGLFLLTDEHPNSPFSRDVQLAYYGPTPLQNGSCRTSGEANVTLDATFGAWTADLTARHSRYRSISRNQRQSGSALITLEDSLNPFASSPESLITVTASRAESRSETTRAQTRANGPAAKLPAGLLQATIEGQVEWDRLRSESNFTTTPERRTRRAEQGIRGALEIPLTSRANGVLPRVGDLGATLELGWTHYSDAGTVRQHAFGLTWEPVPPLRLRAAIEEKGAPASVDILGSPVIITPDTRVFDPLTGGTVDVVQITGGNPDLDAEKVITRRLIGLLRLVPRLKLNLNAEYTDTSRRNFVSSLPESSAAVMLAFPDRFVRDSTGALTAVDLRPVNFDKSQEKRLRWGLSMSSRLGPAPAAPARLGSGVRPSPRPQPTTLQFTANHTMVFSERILIRAGLDPVDLLGGGAVGIGGGRVRHQVDGTAGITSRGSGVRLGLNWRGKSELESRFGGTSDTLHFSPVLKLNLRAFTDARRFFPEAAWAKGLRLSLDVVNLTNDRQEVRNSLGETPLQYQPGYRDPVGRTIEFEVRKVF